MITVVAIALLFSITECKYSAVVRNSTSHWAVDLWTRQSCGYTFTQWKCMCRLHIGTNHLPCNRFWCTVLGISSRPWVLQLQTQWPHTSPACQGAIIDHQIHTHLLPRSCLAPVNSYELTLRILSLNGIYFRMFIIYHTNQGLTYKYKHF